jgi:hypothetical protein
MVLADKLEARHMCPITPFLAIAITDGVIEGIL